MFLLLLLLQNVLGSEFNDLSITSSIYLSKMRSDHFNNEYFLSNAEMNIPSIIGHKLFYSTNTNITSGTTLNEEGDTEKFWGTLTNSSLVFDSIVFSHVESCFVNISKFSTMSFSKCNIYIENDEAIPFSCDESCLSFNNVSLLKHNNNSFSFNSLASFPLKGGSLLAESLKFPSLLRQHHHSLLFLSSSGDVFVSLGSCIFRNISTTSFASSPSKEASQYPSFHSTSQITDSTFFDVENGIYGQIIPGINRDQKFISSNNTYRRCLTTYQDPQRISGNRTFFGDTFEDCINKNGKGGAIEMISEGILKVENCSFARCRSSHATFAAGGGIYASETNLDQDVRIANCVFRDCAAKILASSSSSFQDIQNSNELSRGGALCLGNHSSVEHCTFFNCNGSLGGAIFVNEGAKKCYLNDLVFTSCISTGILSGATGGGGLCVLNARGSILIENCQFASCSANDGVGGGVFVTGSVDASASAENPPIKFKSVSFLSNTAVKDGNDVYYATDYDRVVSQAMFSGCSTSSASPSIVVEERGIKDHLITRPSDNSKKNKKSKPWVTVAIIVGVVVGIILIGILCVFLDVIFHTNFSKAFFELLCLCCFFIR